MSGLEVIAGLLAASGLGNLGLGITALVLQGRAKDRLRKLDQVKRDNKDAQTAIVELQRELHVANAEAAGLTQQLRSARAELDACQPDSAVRRDLRGGVPDVPTPDDGKDLADRVREDGAFATGLP